MKTDKFRQVAIWTLALVIGAILGSLGNAKLNEFFDFVAGAYTRLFQFVAVPTIALAVTTTLASLGARRDTGRIFLHTITYTLLTTIAAALVGLVLFLVIKPGILPQDVVESGMAAVKNQIGNHQQAFEALTSGYGHVLAIIPNNILQPFLAGNVLSILIVAAAVGMSLTVMPDGENKTVLIKAIFGLQELLFTIIKGLVWALPFGIVAFAAQLAQVKVGDVFGSLGKYLAVVLAGNLVQFFIILPLFLVVRGINPLRVFKAMSPAVLMALLTKSSAATLPVTVSSAENNLKARPEVAHFVCPICCTINMNGCAAFILVTSLFVMQHGTGGALSLGSMLVWVLVACIAAIGNAGVPMGCYFLTLALMAGQGMPLGVMGVILPLYTVIDMIETAENVWSDSCVCAMVDKGTRPQAST